jgi:hypothetical protein
MRIKTFAEKQKRYKKKEIIYKHTKGWVFMMNQYQASEKSLHLGTSGEFFELAQKPKKRLRFSAKIKALSKKSDGAYDKFL